MHSTIQPIFISIYKAIFSIHDRLETSEVYGFKKDSFLKSIKQWTVRDWLTCNRACQIDDIRPQPFPNVAPVLQIWCAKWLYDKVIECRPLISLWTNWHFEFRKLRPLWNSQSSIWNPLINVHAPCYFVTLQFCISSLELLTRIYHRSLLRGYWQKTH